MVEYTLRPFTGFNALEINCSSCGCISSLDNPKCLACVKSLDLSFDLLELVKHFSKVYYESGLSSRIKSGKKHDYSPSIVPSFLNFYVLPEKGEKVGVLNNFNILDNNSVVSFSLNPVEYSLSFDDIELLCSIVEKVQSEEVQISDIGRFIPKDKSFLKPLVIRYTTGVGIIEEFLVNDNIQDVYINTPGNSRVFLRDASYGNVSSNVYLKSEMINKISTFMRINSGRPFDEAFPVIHGNLGIVNARICGVSEPLSFNGVGFAIRRHSLTPITLNKLVFDGFLTSQVAGLLWFLIDNKASILITGPRGSGKTSLLGSLLFEFSSNNRFIVIEDTTELPINNLKNLGFNVEHLRTSSFDGSESFELNPETALRTALRLGDSALVVGEVRGEEAKTLFEAMRVGAAGSSVLGTIHGSDAFDTFDRVVNDLKVPSTSFKACDIVVSCANMQFGDLKNSSRRLVYVTEVGKSWVNNPGLEKGFTNIVKFNSSNKKYIWSNLKQSNLLKRIAYSKGVSIDKVLSNIRLRGKIKEFVTKCAKKDRSILSPEAVFKQNEEFNRLVSLYDYSKVYKKFCSYLSSSLKALHLK